MNSLKIGQLAPHFSLQSADGEKISLEGLRASGEKVLLIFLRHLG